MNLAILIDAENMRASIATELFDNIRSLGAATSIRRVYGNWASPHLQEWSGILDKFALKPIHQPGYVTGKNASDMALVIDAMDLLHRFPEINGVCIVSSDSDFTPLALHLRESQKLVYGFGKDNTPDAFKNACHQFAILKTAQNTSANNPSKSNPAKKSIKEKVTNVKPDSNKKEAALKSDSPGNNQPAPQKQPSRSNQKAVSKRYTPQELQNDQKLVAKIQKAIGALQDKANADGYILLSRVATQLKEAGFSQKLYGYARLSDLLKAVDLVEFKKSGKNYMVKRKSA
nr:NYN domain-containing protein [Saezia sanguinis]